MVISLEGKLLIAPAVEPTVAVQFEKVAFPKSASCERFPLTVGLSTIHSADSWLDE